MYQFKITIYFIVLRIIAYYHNINLILSWFILGAIILMSASINRKLKKENIKQQIKNNTAQININKAPWWIIEELPGFKSVNAKKVVWIRKHNGKYISKEDFFKKNDIKDKTFLEKFISI